VNPEVAASLSGGGFSNYFTRPSYQNSTVSAYIKGIGSMHSDLYKCVFVIDIGDSTELTRT
jgi:tripeptidyl-peptidase-1